MDRVYEQETGMIVAMTRYLLRNRLSGEYYYSYRGQSTGWVKDVLKAKLFTRPSHAKCAVKARYGYTKQVEEQLMLIEVHCAIWG